MPYFAVICRDKLNALPVRMENRAAHLDYVAETGVVFIGGPLLEDGQMAGSMLILDVADMAAARDWVAGDPYGKAGLFDSVTINEWKKVVG